jgi:hypothetical protein
MTETARRDAEMDRLLRRTSSQMPETPPTLDCLDAETAAAWLAGELPSTSRERTLAHLADCARCQHLLAALTRLDTEEAAAADATVAPRPWWAYLVPIGAIAALLAIVVTLSKDRLRNAPGAPPAPAQTEALRDVASRLEAAPPDSTNKRRADAPADGRTAALDRDKDSAAGKLEKRAQPAASADVAAQSTRQQAARDVAAAPAPPAPQAAAAAAAPQPLGAANGRRANEEQDAKALSNTVVLSSDRNVQWRFRGVVVEKSTDAGATWTMTSIGWAAAWTAGSAPSSTVCWLVGRTGEVARTVDGRTWQRVTFPAPTDLSAIQASDAQHATITTADGRAFVTTDGGNTWIPRLVQEVPAAPFRE